MNRQLQNKTLTWDWQGEWKITFDFLQKMRDAVSPNQPTQSAANAEKLQSPIWSQLLDAVRTYLIKNG